jgi:hypothetical protein
LPWSGSTVRRETSRLSKNNITKSVFFILISINCHVVTSPAHAPIRNASSDHAPPRTGVPRRTLALWIAVCLLALAAIGALAAPARASSGNASAAAGFIEGAQNKDGGFGEKKGKPSDPEASLWAATALLAAGKNPGDEWVVGGSSLDEYLAAHASAYTSLEDLGLLTIVQSAAQGSSSYGDPGAKLEAALTPSATRADPAGGALGVLGLLALGTPQAKQVATATAQALLTSPTGDGGWGVERLSDSSSTALVLQALAVSGVASSSTAAVQAGVAYLHKAQGNDGSIAPSIRTDQAIASGSVTATAFTIQALQALGLPALATPTGKTVLEGLTQYQQQGTGGLTSDGSLYSQIPPSVTETAQAFPAFDGITFPLASVARATGGPPKKSSASSKSAKSKHVSSGTAAQGVAGTSSSTPDKGAFKQAKANPTPASKAKAGRPAKKTATKQHSAATGEGGTSVNGEVVGAATKPKLTTIAGQSAGGLSAQAKATLLLAALLLACALLGGFLDSRRPRSDGRSLATVSVAAGASFLALARTRGAFAPFAIALVGAALISFPFATAMFDRAPEGAHMIAAFEPYMQTAKLTGYQREVRELDEGFTQGAAKGPALLFPHSSAAAAQQHFQANNPELTQVNREWPQIDRRLSGLLSTIQANRTNYDAVAALPPFTLFPWFFVIPGALLVLLAASVLAAPGAWPAARWALVVLGIGLAIAPLAFGMWTRAPKGAEMVSAFRTVETRALVTKVQNDFATITTGEGALSGELVPALEEHGLNTVQIDRALPAVATLEGHWIAILQDLTPLLGVMSNQVADYHAVAALPSFNVFPWFFLIAGLLVLALIALRGGRVRMPRLRRRPARASRAVPIGEPRAVPGVKPQPVPSIEPRPVPGVEPRSVPNVEPRPSAASAEAQPDAYQPLAQIKERDALTPS